MKIGTKANAIDDLGEFDGSKMTIKVDGKQIYPQKRYAIVRVDGHCPNRFEAVLNESVCKMDKNGECYSRCSESRYGDTKEQLIRKIAQAMFKRQIKTFKRVFGGEFPSKKYVKQIYKHYLEIAKEIVEFLGVE